MRKKTGNKEPDDVMALRKVVGGQALRLLKSGKAVLKIWRNSSPHNWWVEGKRGATYWHSWPGEPYPDLRLFSLLSDSPERVVKYWGADSEQPRLSVYVYNPRAAARSET